jgi:hypothetical protein
MNSAMEIDWKALGAGGAIAFVLLQVTYNFLSPILSQKLMGKPKNVTDVLNDFTTFIGNNIAGLIAKVIDICREIQKDQSVMKSEQTRTHQKVGEILDTRGNMVKEITETINMDLERRIKGIEKMFEAMHRDVDDILREMRNRDGRSVSS